MLANYHTHSEFCDGRATAAEMAEAALSKGYKVLGFSSHGPMPFHNPGNMELSQVGDYVAEVRRLAQEYSERGLEILLGLEIDWIPGRCSPNDALFRDLKLDFSIGSAHFVELPDSGLFGVDVDYGNFEAHLRSYKGGDPGRALYLAYYEMLSGLIEAGGFDILGHFDLVRKNNRDGLWFDEDSREYLDAAIEAARLLKGRDIIVEINVGGLSRGKVPSPYPDIRILRELFAEGVRITFSADAHAPEHLGVRLEDARELARSVGYDSIMVLSRGRWTEVGIDETR